MIFISVVIPTYNLLEDCIKALDPAVQNPSCTYEVIVSDDKVPSDAKKMLEEKYPWAIWVEGAHKGVAANRNNGVKFAKGNWIVFIDNDCIPASNLINTYVKAINDNPETLVFEGCIHADRKKRHFLEEAPLNETGGYFWTCNVMLQKDYFINTIKGFDENFYMYREDVDIRERIKLNGQAIVFIKEAYVIHPWRLQKHAVEIQKQKMVSYNYFYTKHPHLIRKSSLSGKIKNELRFYIKEVLFNLIPYRGRGAMELIKAHIIANKYKKIELDKGSDTTENWTKFY
jgi:GT2 family glycosyltransferase